jgi:hypothetical protein
MKATLRKAVPVVLTAILLIGLSGCGEEHRSDHDKPIRLSHIYGSAFGGAFLGVIVGDKDGKEGEYAAIGAGIFGVGALLSEIDRVNKDDDDDDDDEDEEEVVFQIRNDNGSETAVMLKKKGSTYIGPKGEHYDRLPAAEQLKQIYGS